MNLPMPSMLESKYKGLIYGINILEILCTIPCFVINACYGNDTLLYIACSFAIVIMVLGILGAAFKNTGILIVAGTLSILIALLEISVLFVMYNEFYFNNDYGSTALGWNYGLYGCGGLIFAGSAVFCFKLRRVLAIMKNGNIEIAYTYNQYSQPPLLPTSNMNNVYNANYEANNYQNAYENDPST